MGEEIPIDPMAEYPPFASMDGMAASREAPHPAAIP